MTINLEKHRSALEKGVSLLGAIIYIVSAFTFAKDIFYIHRISSIFPLVLTSLFAYFFLMRGLPKESNFSAYDWLITLNGTFLPMCLRPAPQWHDAVGLLLLQTAGTCISIAGIISLNKSIGLAPANRGIKTFWAYKYVRHPIYTGYFITFGTFCIQNLTAENFLITLMWMVYEILRIFSEEKCLSNDPSYIDYMKKVRWRMFPYIF